MAYEHKKSGTTLFLDVLRRLIILAATCYVVFLAWQWNRAVAVIGAIPIYVVALTIVGFLTWPLYACTPEGRLVAKAEKALDSGYTERAKALADEFAEKFNANVPEQSQGEG